MTDVETNSDLAVDPRDVGADAELAIDLSDVAKTYRGKIKALRGVEMRVARGEIFGLLGPNGAGKSTLVKILMTVIRPSKCKGTMLGSPVGHKATLGRVGYLPEHHRFPEYLTGAQVIDFFGAMAGVARRDRKKRTGELLELVGMANWGKKKVRSYSKGMRQRVGIAQALVNDPDLVVLDEPTDGVDPLGRRDIRGIVERIKDEGRTVFINSHLLSELEMVCDRVAILVEGEVASQGTIDELTEGKRGYEIELELPAETIRAALLDAMPEQFLLPETAGTDETSLALATRLSGTLATGETIEFDGTVMRAATTDPASVQPVIDALRKRGVVIRSVRPVRPSLEDLFMSAVSDANGGTGR